MRRVLYVIAFFAIMKAALYVYDLKLERAAVAEREHYQKITVATDELQTFAAKLQKDAEIREFMEGIRK